VRQSRSPQAHPPSRNSATGPGSNKTSRRLHELITDARPVRVRPPEDGDPGTNTPVITRPAHAPHVSNYGARALRFSPSIDENRDAESPPREFLPCRSGRPPPKRRARHRPALPSSMSRGGPGPVEDVLPHSTEASAGRGGEGRPSWRHPTAPDMPAPVHPRGSPGPRPSGRSPPRCPACPPRRARPVCGEARPGPVPWPPGRSEAPARAAALGAAARPRAPPGTLVRPGRAFHPCDPGNATTPPRTPDVRAEHVASPRISTPGHAAPGLRAFPPGLPLAKATVSTPPSSESTEAVVRQHPATGARVSTLRGRKKHTGPALGARSASKLSHAGPTPPGVRQAVSSPVAAVSRPRHPPSPQHPRGPRPSPGRSLPGRSLTGRSPSPDFPRRGVLPADGPEARCLRASVSPGPCSLPRSRMPARAP